MIYTFPRNFGFGVSDSDLQVIGEDFTQRLEGSEPTMWEHFAKTSGRVFRSQTPGEGIDRYDKWLDDIELMKKIGLKEYRTSVSMSRVLHKDGSINMAAIEWYSRYFRHLRESGIAIYATLYHWELPYFLQERGGWLNHETTKWFLKHVTAVYNNLGEFIEEYFILNEPWCSSMVAYFYGEHAPGEQNLSHALQVAHNLLLAQGLAYKTLRKLDPNAKVSTAAFVRPAYPLTRTEQDIRASKYLDGFINRWFFDPIYLGKYPEDMVELYRESMPSYTLEDMKTIQIGKGLHSLGINYYRGSLAKYDAQNVLHFSTAENPRGEKNDINEPIYLPPHYPEGLYDILDELYTMYKDDGLGRIYVTENGVALNTPWDGKSEVVEDERRIHFLKGHLQQIIKAIDHGIPVEKFFVWTLMDNYEWSEGYRPEASFGLIHIERPTLQRVWKKSALFYNELIRANNFESSDQ